MILRWLQRIAKRHRRSGGIIASSAAQSDTVPAYLSPADSTISVERAEALGLTRAAVWEHLRRGAGDDDTAAPHPG